MYARQSEILAQQSEFAVYRCAHGCVHLRLHQMTLTLTPAEFGRLALLVGEAFVRLATQEAVREIATHKGGYNGARVPGSRGGLA